MDAKVESDPASGKNPTTMERTSEREMVVTRTFKAPARIVFDAWTRPELIKRWWTPKAFGMSFVSCKADVRPGGAYHFVISHPDFAQPMAFFGRYLEATPSTRLVWTNEEADDGGQVTTVTFQERDGETRVVIHELYPSEEALDDAIASGGTGWPVEMFEQLDELISQSA